MTDVSTPFAARAEHVRKSRVIAIVWNKSTATDPYRCADLGLAIMLDKPVVVVAPSLGVLPARVRAIADHFIIGEKTPDEVAEALFEIVNSYIKREASAEELNEGLHVAQETRRNVAEGEFQEPEPWVALAPGERAPFADLPLTCPTCGEENLPLLSDPSGKLTFIRHCGNAWLRGQPEL